MIRVNVPEDVKPIRLRMFIEICIVAALILVCGISIYQRWGTAIRHDRQRELMAIADLKVKQITDWRNDRLTFGMQIGHSPLIIENIKKCLRDPRDSYDRAILTNWMRVQKQAYRFQKIYFTDSTGRILLASPEDTAALAPLMRGFIRDAFQKHIPMLSELHKRSIDGTIHMDLMVPVIDSSPSATRIIGMLIFAINPELFLYPLIQSWPVVSKTSETLLVKKIDTSVVFLNELRYKKNTALTLAASINDSDLPAAMAVRGKTGIIEGIDYRNVPVLAALEAVPGTQWYMVAKIDKSEAYESLHAIGWFSLGLSGLLILLSAVIIGLVWRRRVADIKLAEREQLAVTLRSIGDGVISTDIQGRIVLMNRVAEELTGWTLNEAFGLPLEKIFHIIHEYTRKPCENPVDKVLRTGSIITLANHTVLLSKDGKERIIVDSGAPIKNKQSQTVGVVLVFRDNTDKQRAEEHAINNQKLESIGILAGGIAHDFNNLLFGIFGYLDMAREQSADNEQALHSINKALAVYNRAQDLTRQLLTFSKGGMPVKKTVSLNSIVSEMTHFALSGSNVKCTVEIPDDLWQCDADENQIGQVIDNLIINAKQAMPDGGIMHVFAENYMIHDNSRVALLAGPYVRIAFRDNGPGIAPENLARIFDPFYTTKKTGSGLGLSTCHSILRKHDGCIDVESVVGKGTTFYIYLPALPESLVPEIRNEAASPIDAVDSTHIADSSNMRQILVMDDEDFIS